MSVVEVVPASRIEPGEWKVQFNGVVKQQYDEQTAAEQAAEYLAERQQATLRVIGRDGGVTRQTHRYTTSPGYQQG